MPLGRIALLLPRCQAKSSALVCSGFCSLKVLCASLQDENENGSLPNSRPGAKSLRPHSSAHPQGKAVNRSWLPGLRPLSVLTQPVTEHLYLRAGPYSSLQTLETPAGHTQATPSGKERGSCPCAVAGSLLRKQSPDWATVHGIWQPGAESPLLGLVIRVRVPASMPGSSATLGNPVISVTLGIPR